MRTRSALVVGLVIVLALAVLTVAGCGGGGSDEAAMSTVQASLTKIDSTIADLTSQGTSGSLTVAGIKTARDSLKPDIQSVIDNGKKIKGADTSAVEKAWADLDAAVTALPDSATLADAAGVLITKVTPLTVALDQIRALVAPSTSGT